MHGISMYIFSFCAHRILFCVKGMPFDCTANNFVKFRIVIIHTKTGSIFNSKSGLQSVPIGEMSQEKNSCANFDISSGQLF